MRYQPHNMPPDVIEALTARVRNLLPLHTHLPVVFRQVALGARTRWRLQITCGTWEYLSPKGGTITPHYSRNHPYIVPSTGELFAVDTGDVEGIAGITGSGKGALKYRDSAFAASKWAIYTAVGLSVSLGEAFLRSVVLCLGTCQGRTYTADYGEVFAEAARIAPQGIATTYQVGGIEAMHTMVESLLGRSPNPPLRGKAGFIRTVTGRFASTTHTIQGVSGGAAPCTGVGCQVCSPKVP